MTVESKLLLAVGLKLFFLTRAHTCHNEALSKKCNR
jgi:hypothetical protein